MVDTIRPIDRRDFADVTVPVSFGPAPQLQWIAIDKLGVDDSYQRSLTSKLSRKNVRSIASGFDWRRFAPVIVSPIQGGRFAIIDGQHRTTAALLCGIGEVPCNVVLADRHEQARAFEAINAQVTQISRLQIHTAKIVSGDPEALRVESVARNAGVRILRSNPTSISLKPGDTTAIGAITRMIVAHGDKAVTTALKAIKHSSGDRAGDLRGPIIEAVTTVLADHGEWMCSARLMDIIGEVDLDELWRDATSRAAMQRGTTSQDQLQALLVAYFEPSFKSMRAA